MFGGRRRGEGRLPTVAARSRGRLTAPPGFPDLVAVGVGPDGPVAAWAGVADAGRLHDWPDDRSTASFRRARPPGDPTVALTAYAFDGTLADVTVVAGLPVAFPLVQPWPGGGYLVVGARCRWSEDGPEQNALVIAPDGSVTARGCLGDGIQHLLVDGAGTVWAGYFDEGVHGSLGWGGPGPAPLGAAGIVRWSGDDFRPLWEFPHAEWAINDCYALNVAGPDEVWACTASDFPVLALGRGRVRLFRTSGVRGPHGIVAAGASVGLLGAYGNPGLLVTGQLVSWRFAETGRAQLVTPGGRPLPPVSVHCRGPVASLFAGADWFTLDLTDR